MNAWVKDVFNLDLNRESVSEPRTLSGRLFQSLGAKYEKVLPPLVDYLLVFNALIPLNMKTNEIIVKQIQPCHHRTKLPSKIIQIENMFLNCSNI